MVWKPYRFISLRFVTIRGLVSFPGGNGNDKLPFPKNGNGNVGNRTQI